MTFAERVIELNRWYDSLPEPRRIMVYPAVLLAAGAINMHWTGSPFGLVFLLALAVLFVLRRSVPRCFRWVGRVRACLR
jgi:MYXO-CTERM domain-containing protein